MKHTISISWFYIFAMLFALLSSLPVMSQYQSGAEEENQEKAGTFFIAPDFGLMLGTVTRIDISPSLGYYLTNRLSVAIGGRYEYLSDSRQYSYYRNFKTHIFGTRAYAELDVIQNLNNIIPLGMNSGIFGHIEYEGLSLERAYFDYSSPGLSGRFWHSTMLIGAGLRQPAGNRVAFNILVLWDTDTTLGTLYNNPVIRMGFVIYL
ncbi:MAG TPA: hypothetical protein VE870_11100 [Bacteroidales bacterium]|nr:hypothetical protein [Bacteroidales bacterium]